jgi:hypothetical protein
VASALTLSFSWIGAAIGVLAAVFSRRLPVPPSLRK